MTILLFYLSIAALLIAALYNAHEARKLSRATRNLMEAVNELKQALEDDAR